jgi:hypothetical protein
MPGGAVSVTWIEYLELYGLKKDTYTRDQVEQIRKHAYIWGSGANELDRSEKQNAYYWKVIVRMISMDTGHTEEEVHEYLKDQFCIFPNKAGVPVKKSSARLKTHEFEEYAKRCRTFASTELGIFIPMPNETEYKYDKEPNNGKTHNGPGIPAAEKQNSTR